MNDTAEKTDLIRVDEPAPTTMGEIMLNAPLMQQIDHLAQVMASATVTVPKHLQGSVGDCSAIVMQAIQWRMSPFVVAQKTHLVNGTLGYEAQLVNAVVKSSGAIEGGFAYEYRTEVNGNECRVGARLKGQDEITWGEWLSMKDVKVQNSPLWKTNWKQQMGYLQVKNWVRLYCPEALLGVYTVDELQDSPPIEREVGPKVSDLNAKLRTVESETIVTEEEQDAIDAEFVEAEPDQSEPEPEPDETNAVRDQVTVEYLKQQIDMSKNTSGLSALVPLIEAFLNDQPGNEKHRNELGAAYRAKSSSRGV